MERAFHEHPERKWCKPNYNGFYAFNPVVKAIGFYCTSSEGELTIGTATPDPGARPCIRSSTSCT